jgi:3-methyladenine DNA glycosylase AlkD
MGNAKNVEGMMRFGISSNKTLGVSVSSIRSLARKVGTNHRMALELWKTGIHEAKILAAMVDDPKEVTESQMERWVKDFDSWDICDECCGILFDKTPHAFAKATEWAKRKEEFVKRAGFVMMAELAVHEKAAPDSAFLSFFGPIEGEATDSRNFVKKAVNWALRQIGKRNLRLNGEAIKLARRIQKIESSSAKWIASDALRELTSDAVQKKLRRSS